MLKTLLGFGLLVVVGYLAVAAFVFFSQKSLLFYPEQPTRTLAATPRDIGLDYADVALSTSDGVTLHGWYVPVEAARGVVIFCHGNAGNISHRLDSLQIFHRLDLSVLIFDYRGYGQSEGRISEQGTYRDARAAWRYLTNERDIAPERIVVFGRSLGAAVAARLAVEHPPGVLIVESAFRSVPAMGRRLYPYLPVGLLSRYRYDTEQAVRAVERPVLVIHSVEDEIIPFEEGKAVFEAASGPKHLLRLSGGHNEGFLVSGDRYTDGIDAFITRWLPDARS